MPTMAISASILTTDQGKLIFVLLEPDNAWCSHLGWHFEQDTWTGDMMICLDVEHSDVQETLVSKA